MRIVSLLASGTEIVVGLGAATAWSGGRTNATIPPGWRSCRSARDQRLTSRCRAARSIPKCAAG